LSGQGKLKSGKINPISFIQDKKKCCGSSHLFIFLDELKKREAEKINTGGCDKQGNQTNRIVAMDAPSFF